jgi:flagellar basal body rod protein FlgB
MNLTPLLTDNVSEFLIMIIEFTQARQKILAQNITNANQPDFMPKELEVTEFTDMLNNAIDEHVKSNRLILCDTENIKFGQSCDFYVKPVNDQSSKELLGQSLDEYIELQINKLMENSINQRVAAEMLKQKCQKAPCC